MVTKSSSESPKVRVSNALIDACYRPDSLYQMRLLLAAIAQIEPGGKLTHKTEFEINAAGIADLIGVGRKGGSYFAQLKRAADELVIKHITVYEHHDGSRRDKRYTKINFVSRCTYIEDEAKVVLQFTPSIIPYIAQFRGRYETYLLKTAMRMKSGYGIRLYEMAHRFNTGKYEWEFEVDEFKRIMGIEDKYPKIAELKRRVIYPAVRDVNKHTEFTIEYGERRRGKKIVTHVQFKIANEEKKEGKTEKTAALSPDGKIQKPKDFEAYAKPVLANGPLGQQVRNGREGRKILRDELAEGTIRDVKTGRKILDKGKPVKT